MASSETKSSDHVQSPSWEERPWSEWYLLDTAIAPGMAKAPNTAGLYRLRCRGRVGLIYIGETGTSLRGRFRQLRKATEYAGQGKPAGPPHVAGNCVFKRESAGLAVEVSWVETPQLDSRDRKGVECELIAAYRKTMRTNPACQFAGTFEDENGT